jgi:hypothetical protein
MGPECAAPAYSDLVATAARWRCMAAAPASHELHEEAWRKRRGVQGGCGWPWWRVLARLREKRGKGKGGSRCNGARQGTGAAGPGDAIQCVDRGAQAGRGPAPWREWERLPSGTGWKKKMKMMFGN